MSSTGSAIHIIGIGGDGLKGLTAHARELLQAAEVVLGSDQALDLAPELQCERHPIGPDLQEVVRLLEKNRGRRRMAVLAPGDPLFYGVARYLCDRVGKEHFEVLPHVSSMQLAFARIKETWEEAYLTNLASHALEDVLDRIRTAETVGLFTSKDESPPIVANKLLANGIDYFRVFVCENLGSPDERVTQGELTDIVSMEFSPLNVMILKRKPGRPDQQRLAARFRRFGNPDEVFAQSKPKSGLLTHAEVRAIGLAQMDVQPASVVWDIGAGTGSVSIEAAQLATQGAVYAIEEEVTDYHLIIANAQAFGVRNVKPVHGTAPAVFASLPKPDAIFVGGTGSQEVARLLNACYESLRPGGRLVVNVATLESIASAYDCMRRLASDVDVMLIQISRGQPQMETLRFEAANPTFLLTVSKPKKP